MQKGVTDIASGALEDLLHTDVTIGRVDLGYFNRVILDDIRVKDLNDKDLLRAARLSAKMELTALLHRKISISNIQFYGFDLQLYQQAEGGKPNFNSSSTLSPKRTAHRRAPTSASTPFSSGAGGYRGTANTSHRPQGASIPTTS